MVGALAVFGLLVWLSRRALSEGSLTLVLAVSYGAVRFVEAFFGLDVTHGTCLNGSQWTVLVAMVAATIGLVVLQHRAPGSTAGVAGHGVNVLPHR